METTQPYWRVATQKDLILHALKYPKQWHSYEPDKKTVELICATANLGIIEVNNNDQFRLKSEIKAKDFLNNR